MKRPPDATQDSPGEVNKAKMNESLEVLKEMKQHSLMSDAKCKEKADIAFDQYMSINQDIQAAKLELYKQD